MDLFSGLNLEQNVSNFKTSTQNAMKSVKSNTLTPADTTAKNIKQGVAIKSARDTDVKGKVTGYRDQADEELDGLVGMISGGLLKTKDITKAIRVGKDGVTFSEDAILGDVSGELGVRVNSKSGAMRRLNAMLGSEFKKLTGFNLGGILTTDGKTFRVTKNWKGQVGKQVLNTLGNIVGIDEFLDRSVKGAMYNSVLNSVIDYGMSDSYKKLWDSYPKGFELIKRDAVLDGMRTAITNGDLESLSKLLELLEQEGKNILMSKYPDFIERLFSNFKFDDDVNFEDWPRLLELLQQILVGLIGPDWYMKYTEHGPAYNLTLVAKVSKDMKILLMQWPEIVPLVCSAGVFSTTNAVAELKRQFKGAPQYAY